MTTTYKAPLVEGWEVVIGLEIHCQLNTNSKIFSGSSTEFGNDPNTQANAVDLALPGTLPVVNKAAIEKAIRFGLGINAELGMTNVFARKNYFYPDLPKGYQTSQMDDPIVGFGHLDLEVEYKKGEFVSKRIGVTRAHLEEDAGKSLHGEFQGMTGIDLNRAGTPLLEIVTEPDMRSIPEALACVKKLHTLVRWLGISDGNMAEGSFRCDCNVSIRRPGDELGNRCELKNINSFRFIERAIEVEIDRQIDILEKGDTVTQETRLFDPVAEETRSMRSKEEANDYRYFPCPDLLPVVLTDEMIADIRDDMPELPDVCKARYEEKLGLTSYDAGVLTGSRELAQYFEATLAATEQATDQKQAKQTANWVMGELLGALNKAELELATSPISPEQLGGMLKRISDSTINGKIAKQVFAAMMNGEGGTSANAADKIIADKGLKQENDEGAVIAIIQEVLAKNQTMVDEYKGGKEKAFNGLVGQVMKASRGKANPAQVNQLLKQLIG